MSDNGVSPGPAPDLIDPRVAPLLDDLTGPQREAVGHTEGPLLVLAAAGSGKTRVITRRIAYLVELGVPAWRILALTFTNKAAGEMRERVTTLLAGAGRSTRGLTVTTFHSLCARLLRRYAEHAGLKPEFTIYDAGDQLALLKRVLESLSLSSSNWPPRSVLSAISDAKNKLIDPEKFAIGATDFYSKTVAKVYASYQQALRAASAVDFDDLLVRTASLLKSSAHVRDECRARWRHLLIDEYQDTNHAQFMIASLLAGEAEPGGPGPNICVVGDPDQAIYGWRGADIGNILEFEDHYPGCRVIALGENFRSTAPVLGVADSLIRRNRRRKHKDLFTRRAGGEKVEVVYCRDEQHEAALVADWLKARHEHSGEGASVEAGLAWREMAVFYRTNALSRVVEDAMRAANIPYTVARGTAFYEREEIKNALSYLRLVANPADDVSLDRIVNVPARGLGSTTITRLEVRAAEQGVPVLEALRSASSSANSGLTARAVNSAAKFIEMIDAWTGAGSFMGESVPASLAELVERVVRESGLEAMYRAQAQAGKSEADLDRLDNLSELVSSARQFEAEYDGAADPAGFDPFDPLAGAAPPLLSMLRAYLESIALIADADAVDPAQGAVTLMTLHAAKGLEFGAVAIVGLEEGLLPHSRAADSEAQLEEERRLCFVGITRAMRRLMLTSARYRTIRGLSERTISSRFLDELNDQHTSVKDMADVFAGLEETEWSGRDFEGARRERLSGPPDPGSRSGTLRAGVRVRHPQFGLGTIRSIIAGGNARAVVDFPAVGTKTLVLQYARLEQVP